MDVSTIIGHFCHYSVFSVLCFALVINDIINVVPNGVSCSLYVGDFVLYLSSSNLSSAVRGMQLAINRVADWAESHGFRFSVEKYHAVFFRRTRRVPKPSLTLYGCLLSGVREVHFLGIIIDYRLTWVPHLRLLRLAC